MLRQTVYLDNAAATPMDTQVRLVMEPYLSDNFYNPSATYLAAKAVAKDIEQARAQVASFLGCKSTEIIFTAGGTEANNLAINGVMQSYPQANLVISSVEHESVIKPAEQYDHKLAPVKQDGIIDISKLEVLIDDRTVLVSVMYANNEIGTIQPLQLVHKLLEKIRKQRSLTKNDLPIYLHCDACQAPNYLDLHVSRLGINLMTINSGKIYGPKQFGALFVSRQIKLKPQILGGGQENGARSGTENPANIVGLAKALDLVQKTRSKEGARLRDLQDYFIDQLGINIPNLVINGSRLKRLPNNVHITIPGQDNELMLMKLDELGVQCASGSACNASNQEISQTLLAVGLTDEQARSSLRFSMGRSTTKKDIEYVVDSITKILE
jgi:cysteine desulfurase